MMQALVYQGPERLTLSQIEEPVCQSGQVLLRVLAAGICGSDLNGYLGRSARRIPPLVLGHEISAEVMSDPSDVLPVGTRVAVFPLLSCGLVGCEPCASNHPNRCPQRQLLGMDLPGGFADLIAVDSTACFPLPDTVSDVAGALIEPLANAVHLYDAILRIHGPVRRVAIIGAGGQGLMALLTGRHLGIQCDVIEPNDSRRDRALALGARSVFHPDTPPQAAPDRGYEAVIETAGYATSRSLAVRIAAPGATILYLGLHDPTSTTDDLDIINRELTVMGSYAYNKRDFQRALDLAATHALDIEAFSTPMMLTESVQVFDRLANRPGDLIKAVLLMKGHEQ